jgi:hypothetical protein
MNLLINDAIKELKKQYTDRELRELLMGIITGTHTIHDLIDIATLDNIISDLQKDNEEYESENRELSRRVEKLQDNYDKLVIKEKKKKPKDIDKEIDKYLDDIRYYEILLDSLQLQGYKIKRDRS